MEISKIKELEGHFQIHDKENKLIIPKPTVKDAGNYTCSIPELKLSADIRAIGEWGSVEAMASVLDQQLSLFVFVLFS